MRVQQIKFSGSIDKYSILIGNNILGLLPKRLNKLCPKTKKIAIIVDKNVPKKFKYFLRKKLIKYELIFLDFVSNEKAKSLKTANSYLEKLLSKNLNRSDLIISVGGGITGDVVGFIASIYKRGINFINIPTTLLAQVDSSIGGKTGVNSNLGKNLVGSFYQPKLVISDTAFLNSLPSREIICGYAEILKHAVIKDYKFFNWLKINSKKIFSKNPKILNYAIKKSCEIKTYFVNKDVNEKNLRMILNFGHTFAHAIEVKNNFSNKISHGEAVLSGMILESRLSYLRGICNFKSLMELKEIYIKNNLSYTYKQFSKKKTIDNLIPFLKNDKKNEDEKINFILLKKIGTTTKPNKNKIKLNYLKLNSKLLLNRNF